jgi:hypothetical protein
VTLRKTSKGQEEIATRKYRLLPKYRSALILVDGRKSASDLRTTLSTLGDADEIISYLAKEGFIETLLTGGDTDGGAPTTTPLAEANVLSALPKASLIAPGIAVGTPPASARSLESAKRAAVKFLSDTFGPQGDDMCMRVEQAKTVAALVPVISRLRSTIENIEGKEKADRFWALVSQHLPA